MPYLRVSQYNLRPSPARHLRQSLGGCQGLLMFFPPRAWKQTFGINSLHPPVLGIKLSLIAQTTMNVAELIGSLRALDVHADKVSLLNTHSKIIKDALWRDLKLTGATKLLIELALEVEVNPDHVRSVEIRFRAAD